MKKILFLNHTLGVGGAEKVLVNLVNGLDKTKYDVTVMTVIDTGIFKNDLDSNVKYKTIFKLPFHLNNGEKSGSLQSKTSSIKNILKKMYQFFWKHVSCKWIYNKFVKDDYDYEIAFLEGICAKILAASTNENAKKFVWLHIDIINENKSDAFFKNLNEQKKCYDSFDKIVCVSDVVKTQSIKKLNLDKSKFVKLYNSINSDEIREKSLLKEIKHSTFSFATVGRLATQKGYDRLINVSKRLKNEGYDFKVQIIGEGPEEFILKKMVSNAQLQNVVQFLGFQSNPYPYIKASDVFICPSRAEGFSTVASEAVVLHKACLVTDCSGMGELFGKNGEYGLIVDNTEDGIYKGMKLIINNVELISKLEQKSVENSKRFNLKESILLLEKELLNE